MRTGVEDHNGWANRETWAVALWINNDQGWQESVHEALSWAVEQYRAESDIADPASTIHASTAGGIVRENVENLITADGYRDTYGEQIPEALVKIAEDIGSLYRVDWYELGAAFLCDLAEQGAVSS